MGGWVKVEIKAISAQPTEVGVGLSWAELGNKSSSQDYHHNDLMQVLNGLEQMGYRVVTSSCMVTGFTKHDTRDFIWTMHKAKADWEACSM